MIVIGVGLVSYTSIKANSEKTKYLKNYYIVYAANEIVNETKNKVKHNLINCNTYEFSGHKGISYVYYPDVGKKTFLAFYYMRDPIEGYVKIDTSGDEPKYYVSLTDGNYGFPETLYEDVRYKTVVEYKVLDRSYDQAYECRAH